MRKCKQQINVALYRTLVKIMTWTNTTLHWRYLILSCLFPPTVCQLEEGHSVSDPSVEVQIRSLLWINKKNHKQMLATRVHKTWSSHHHWIFIIQQSNMKSIIPDQRETTKTNRETIPDHVNQNSRPWKQTMPDYENNPRWSSPVFVLGGLRVISW